MLIYKKKARNVEMVFNTRFGGKTSPMLSAKK